jgi:hypothetical protein
MRRVAVSVTATVLLAGAMIGLNVSRDHSEFAAAFTTSASAQASACAFPTAPAATPEQTAWQLFVAANCPGNTGKVVWEEWVEQLQLYPACPTCNEIASVRQMRKRLHGSPLAEILRRGGAPNAAPALAPSSECGTMNGPPPNVIAQVICEEARLNPEAAAFVTGDGYQVRAGQTAAAQNNTDIEFPTAAIEVKVDWIPATDFPASSTFNCTTPQKDIHVEMIDGTCYVLAGMHISSKLLKNWLWATFEPQSMLTNPLRCITFGNCNDPWGSNPAVSSGGTGGVTQLTQPLKDLMTAANLAPAFFNYRLDGVQTDFGTAAAPTLLGNSVIEGENVGMQKNTASCITCHSESSIKKNGADFAPHLQALVGPQYKVPTGSIARDFVWSLALACPGAIGPQECE